MRLTVEVHVMLLRPNLLIDSQEIRYESTMYKTKAAYAEGFVIQF